MKKYTNKNKFFQDIIDEKLQEQLQKDRTNGTNNYLCDIDYAYRHKYKQCKIVSQLKEPGILGNKWYQYKHFKEWCEENGKIMPDYVPVTYLINKEKIDEKFIKQLFINKNKWIIKPENGSFRAGIKVVNNYNSLLEWINKYVNSKWIIQDYIDNPLKLEKRKIHFRIYVLLIKTKTYSQVLVYNKGYIFLSKKEYDADSLDDESNLSGGDTKEQMRLYPHQIIKNFGIYNYKKILKQINVIVKETMDATINNLECINSKMVKYKCYKLLGYDILINEDFKLYLGEINSRTVNVKFPIKNMYQNLIDIILAEGPLTNKYLMDNNLNYYSIINKKHSSVDIAQEEKMKGGAKNNMSIGNIILFIIVCYIIYILLKKYNICK